MSSTISAHDRLERRRNRVRAALATSTETPRLTVSRSLRHIYAQVIDDMKHVTVTSADDAALKITGTKTERARAVGKAVAERALAAGITEVRFDRGGRRYHGRVAALADAAREAGLRF